MEIIRNRILKPLHAKANPCKAIPLTIFDKAAFNLHVTVLCAFLPPMPTNDALIQGLTEALAHFPHLAGRLSDTGVVGHPTILLNGAGIRLVEANVSSTLAEALPLKPSEEMSLLHPPIEGVEELLQIQLNRYTCGGVVIGQTAHHRVCDGQSMSSFFLAWARLVKGMEVDPIPYHDRAAVSVPRNPPRTEHNHGQIEFKNNKSDSTALPSSSSSSIVNLVLHYSADFISELKKLVNDSVGDDMPSLRCTTFQCFLTHIWKKMTLARGLKGEEMSQVRVAVNGRFRIKPSVPAEYFGNFVLWAYPRLKVEDLLNQSYKFVAKAINEAVAKVDSGYFQSFIDFGELKKGEELQQSAAAVGNMLSPNLEVDSWLSFRFHEIDFGHGGPCAFLPCYLPIEGLLLLVPSPKEKGGVDVFIAVAEDDVERFKLVSHSLA